MTNRAWNDRRSQSVQNWVRSGCQDPLVVWPSEPANYPGIEIPAPPTAALNLETFMPREIPATKLYRFSDITFSSDGGAIYRDGRAFENNIMPNYADIMKSNDLRRGSPEEGSHEDLENAFILLHNSYGTYGHFLLEMAPKLIAYRYLLREINNLPILLSWYTPPYILQWINLLVPDNHKAYIKKSGYLKVRSAFYCDMLLFHFALARLSAFFARLMLPDSPKYIL